ncbi:MAG: sterol desaturase family protein [Pyrinomonadaceae bacterium]|nr:sterol desaturase family protein [Pyrinomonadaceae bacterium]
MLKPQYIAIPLFAVFIAIEAFLILRSGRDEYDSKDAWTNILIGLISAIFGTLLALATSIVYITIYELSPFKMPMNSVWPWLILIIADDLLYYWFHRISHESRLFWNFHVVHHSSYRYNLSVAVRQSWFSGVLHWIFYLPAAFVGFPFWAFALVHGFNLIYQFWIHTELVDRLGPLEWILNTPSHHRVHHGINPQYLDKNYAGIFIVWDRMFGTFEPEDEPVEYGITTGMDSYNPLWINTHAWFEMLEKLRSRSGFLEKLRCIFLSPDMNLERVSALTDQEAMVTGARR